MAIVRVPSNVTALTLIDSGVLIPISGLITCTPLEATALCQATNWGPGDDSIESSFGDAVNVHVPYSVLSGIEIDSEDYPINNGIIEGLPNAAANIFLFSNKISLSRFVLVSG